MEILLGLDLNGEINSIQVFQRILQGISKFKALYLLISSIFYLTLPKPSFWTVMSKTFCRIGQFYAEALHK